MTIEGDVYPFWLSANILNIFDVGISSKRASWCCSVNCAIEDMTPIPTVPSGI